MKTDQLKYILLLLITPLLILACSKEKIPEDDEVFIEAQKYTPKTLNIQRGVMVTWSNQDEVPHTVTRSDDPDSFNSGQLSPGESFKYTFKTSGHFSYFCTVHDDQHIGYVIVE